MKGFLVGLAMSIPVWVLYYMNTVAGLTAALWLGLAAIILCIPKALASSQFWFGVLGWFLGVWLLCIG